MTWNCVLVSPVIPYHDATTLTVYVPGTLSKSENSALNTPQGSVNALVVSVFLLVSTKKIGVAGALSVSTGALGLAAASMIKLKLMVGKEEK